MTANEWMFMLLEKAGARVKMLHELVGWRFNFTHDARVGENWQHHVICGMIAGAQCIGVSERKGFRDTDGKVVLTTDRAVIVIPNEYSFAGYFGQTIAIIAKQSSEGWRLICCVPMHTKYTNAIEGTLRLSPPQGLTVEIKVVRPDEPD